MYWRWNVSQCVFVIVLICFFQCVRTTHRHDGSAEYDNTCYDGASWSEVCVDSLNKCYQISSVRKTYDKGVQCCIDKGVKMVVLETDEEEERLNQEIDKEFRENKDYWLRIVKDKRWVVDGHYLTDVPVNRFNWDPVPTGDGNYVYTESRGKWQKTRRCENHFVICEANNDLPFSEQTTRSDVIPSRVPGYWTSTSDGIQTVTIGQEDTSCLNGVCFHRIDTGRYTVVSSSRKRSVLGCAASCAQGDRCKAFRFNNSSGVCMSLRVLMTKEEFIGQSTINCQYETCYKVYI